MNQPTLILNHSLFQNNSLPSEDKSFSLLFSYMSSFPTPGPSGPRLKVRTDFDKVALKSNFDKKIWQYTTDRDWNFYWASVQTVRQIFNPDGGYPRLNEDQIINHFPNHVELTRKDLMVKNIKRYRREAEKENSHLTERDANGSCQLDIFPTTYVLPADYSIFVEEFKRNPNSMWIMKPTSKAQGKGIFIINKLSQIKKWASQRWQNLSVKEAFIVSRYIDNPFLLGGKKFDLRLYYLVTSYRPLRVYSYAEGFARVCNVKYTNDADNIDNLFVHLTNVAIQKQGDEYNDKHGNKWSYRNLRMFIEATRGYEACQRLWDAIQFIVVHSLKSVQNVMVNDKHCFECYGFDIMIDDNLKPWLIEVNASPSLTHSTPADRVMKTKLIHDILQVVIPPDWPETKTSKGAAGWNQQLVVGGFELIYDEAYQGPASDSKTSGRERSGSGFRRGGGGQSRWR